MGGWIITKRPKEKVNVLVKIKFEDGQEQTRIGWLKHPCGVKSEWYFVIPKYEGEPIKKWEVIGWQKLPN